MCLSRELLIIFDVPANESANIASEWPSSAYVGRRTSRMMSSRIVLLAHWDDRKGCQRTEILSRERHLVTVRENRETGGPKTRRRSQNEG